MESMGSGLAFCSKAGAFPRVPIERLHGVVTVETGLAHTAISPPCR